MFCTFAAPFAAFTYDNNCMYTFYTHMDMTYKKKTATQMVVKLTLNENGLRNEWKVFNALTVLIVPICQFICCVQFSSLYVRLLCVWVL